MVKKFKDLCKEKELIRLVGAHDGLSAKLIEQAGFDGIWSSGFEISTSHAVPDCSVLSKDAFLERAREMRRVVEIPILVDMDTGYGGVGQVGYHIKEFEAAGINGVAIEDKVFPKTNSYIPGQNMLSPEDFAVKIYAAKQAQETEDFIVVARVESFISGMGLDDAIYRAKLYKNAGADAILIHSKATDGKDIRAFMDQYPYTEKCPVVIVPTSYATAFTEPDMVAMGIRVVIYANHGIRAMIKGAKEALSAIYDVGINFIDSHIATMDEVFELQGMFDFKKREKSLSIYET